jgi:hypothetical protein
MNTQRAARLREIGYRAVLVAFVAICAVGVWAVVHWLGWPWLWAGAFGLAATGWVNACMVLARYRADLTAAEARAESLNADLAVAKLYAQIGADRAFARGKVSGLVASAARARGEG